MLYRDTKIPPLYSYFQIRAVTRLKVQLYYNGLHSTAKPFHFKNFGYDREIDDDIPEIGYTIYITDECKRWHAHPRKSKRHVYGITGLEEWD